MKKTSKSISPKLMLAIETSCDETAAAVLKLVSHKIEVLSSVVKSQTQLHSPFGGVVPEVAARAHVKNILPVVEKAISDAHLTINDINLLAVTQGPGLIPSLIVGVEFAKAFSLAAGIPIVPINHLAGHLYSPYKSLSNSTDTQIKKLFPMISLIVSGGHTILALMKDIKHYKILGETVDDAAGEAFDKVAKLLSLPYPGGPQVSKLAEQSKAPVDFPRPMVNSKDYNFSFAGLKTAVLYYLRDHPKAEPADICAGFQNAVVDVLVAKTLRAVKQYHAKSISLSGGVAANRRLREELSSKAKIQNLEFFVPPMNLCTDNAEMIGLAAAFALANNTLKPVSAGKIGANPNLSL